MAMPTENTPRRPGDLFLDRYMPDAKEEEREAARGHLREFAAVLLRIFTYAAEQEYEQAIRARSQGPVE
jgi:hypothetical protein